MKPEHRKAYYERTKEARKAYQRAYYATMPLELKARRSQKQQEKRAAKLNP